MRTNLDKNYKVNGDYELGGVWFQISEEVSFKIKRFGGRNASNISKKLAEYQRPYLGQIKNKTLSDETATQISTKVFVETSIVDWKGVEIDGEEVPFSKEQCIVLLSELPDLADTLVEYASDINNYQEELGNS